MNALLGAALIAGLSCSASAQVIQWTLLDSQGNTLDGGTVNSGAPFTVDVGVLDQLKLLRVFDPQLLNGLPNDDAGKITITGTPVNGSELRILVAEGSWPSDFTQLSAMTAPGVRNLGAAATDGVEVPNAELRALVRLAAYVTDDVRGTITVGQVQRIQAGFRPPGGIPNPGTVSANITAVSPDAFFDSSQIPYAPAVGYISAGNAITGDITATGVLVVSPFVQRSSA